jgi:hypothetical protein
VLNFAESSQLISRIEILLAQRGRYRKLNGHGFEKSVDFSSVSGRIIEVEFRDEFISAADKSEAGVKALALV